MKTRFSSNKELAHVWAQQNQSEGRANNMFFDGASIFSYGRHFEIARFAKSDVVLFNARTYSSSTSKHQSYTRRAITNKTVFFVPSMFDHNTNVASMITDFTNSILELKRGHSYIQSRYDGLNHSIDNAERYLKTFLKDIALKNRGLIRGMRKRLAKEITPEWLAAKLERAKVLEARAAIRYEQKRAADAVRWEAERIEREKRDAERLIEEKEELAKWLNGEDVRSYFSGPIQLRIKGDEIQTTGGANVPLIEARKFWHALQRRENVVGMRLGHYTVDELDGDTLRVGCHNIPVREVVRMARALKWNDGITLEAVQS